MELLKVINKFMLNSKIFPGFTSLLDILRYRSQTVIADGFSDMLRLLPLPEMNCQVY